MSQSPESSQPTPSPREERSSQESQPELPSQQIESDKLDNIVKPDRNNSAVARDENTGHNRIAAGVNAPAVDAPAVNAPPAVTPPETAATAGSALPETTQPEATYDAAAQPESGEPATVQFPAVPPEATGPVSDSAPQAGQPEPVTEQFPAVPPEATGPVSDSAPQAGQPEPVTEQFPAVPPEATEPVSHSEPVPAASQAEPVAATEPDAAEPVADAAPSDPAPAVTVRSRAAAQPHVRVDARLLEAALLNLRKRIAAIPLVFQISGSVDAKAERGKLLSQIDDYLLPRVRRSAAPVLVALVGSTGAGKSTLVNSIVGANVSATGVRRPTTNSPVLACHPDEIDWFAENNFLPTLPRVRQEGLARPGRDGLLVLAASEGMPRGIALLDTPDIDSVVQAHHEFAYQFLDASDLWLFMTSASRYADGPVWEILQHARDRKASLGVVLSRIPQAYRTELVDHFNAMLDANGIAAADRFVIPEIPLIDGMLPADAYQPIRDWLADTADRADRRVAVLSQNDVWCARHVQDQDPCHRRARRGAGRAARRAAAGRRDRVWERLHRGQHRHEGRHPAPRRGARSLGGLRGGRRPAAAPWRQARPERKQEGQARTPRTFAVGCAERLTPFGHRVVHRVRRGPRR